MAVYVDPAVHPFGRMIMCHLWADSLDELHGFAARLGLKRAWFQEPPKASWCHYDVGKRLRARAIALGAIPVDGLAAVEARARQVGDARKLAFAARCRTVRAEPQGRLGFDLTRSTP